MVQKIKDFILKDVQSENETKKTAADQCIDAVSVLFNPVCCILRD